MFSNTLTYYIILYTFCLVDDIDRIDYIKYIK